MYFDREEEQTAYVHKIASSHEIYTHLKDQGMLWRCMLFRGISIAKVLLLHKNNVFVSQSLNNCHLYFAKLPTHVEHFLTNLVIYFVENEQ